MKLEQLRNIVAFCALMENGAGILDKSPEYIIEKFNRYCLSDIDETAWGLDSTRKMVIYNWEVLWDKQVKALDEQP